MPHKITLLSNPIFISDAHYNSKRLDLEHLLGSILNKKVVCNQLILCGDMCDLLIGSVSYTLEYNRQIIDLINSISKTIEVIYIEGNHDFDLKGVFTKTRVFSIKEQPVVLEYKNNKILLLHGDKFVNEFFYENIYVPLLRNRVVLRVLNFIDSRFKNIISKKIILNQINKKKCFKIKNFKNRVEARKKALASFGTDIVLEGHHHQDETISQEEFIYINMPAFVCSNKYLELKDLTPYLDTKG
jgi:UDP-2,3-diacylglucosamine hydrolase